MSSSLNRRRPAFAALAASGALAAIALGPAAPAHAAADLAVQDDGVFLLNKYGNRPQALARAKQMNARWVRINLIWGDWIGKNRSFAQWDSAVNAARAQGLRVHITICGTPNYTNQDLRLSWKNPSPTVMRFFSRRIAQHFRGRVKRYSLGNEMNLVIWLKRTKNSPTLYRNFYKAGYGAIKAVDPTADVFIGELASGRGALDFLNKVAKPGANLRADGLAHHPFQFNVIPGKPDKKYLGISNLPQLQAATRKWARTKGVRTKSGGALPIHYTEFGYLRRGLYPFSEPKRVQWTRAAYRVVRSQPAIKTFLWYQLYTPPVAKPLWDSSIIRLNNQPYSVFNAIVQSTKGWPQRPLAAKVPIPGGESPGGGTGGTGDSSGGAGGGTGDSSGGTGGGGISPP